MWLFSQSEKLSVKNAIKIRKYFKLICEQNNKNGCITVLQINYINNWNLIQVLLLFN